MFAAQATGFPALLIILGVIGLLVAGGMAIGGRRDRARTIALICLGAVVVGLLIANFD